MLSEPITEPLAQILVDNYFQQLLTKIARKYTSNTTITWEDAVQTANVKVLEALQAGRFRQGGVQEFQRWAIVVARYEIINLVKKEQLRNYQSLDATIIGTDLSLLDTIADEFNLLDAVERTDLVLRVKEAIAALDIRYKERGYLKLWQGMVTGKKQTQLASELKISQGEISRRWQELVGRVAVELGLLSTDMVKEKQQKQVTLKQRRRSKVKW